MKKRKINLSSVVKKTEYITASIKDFTLFFIFIRRFYTLAIKKENFKSNGKSISLKLIDNLKDEEENLYKEYVVGDCFSKVLSGLGFENVTNTTSRNMRKISLIIFNTQMNCM